MSYKARTTAPEKSNKWFYADNPFYKSGYGLPNCTAYAWGRFAELMGKAPKLCLQNAENWYKYDDGYKRGKAPKLGAIIVWAKGAVGNAADGAGHVAVVERINSDGSFVVSESGWKASATMWTKTIPKSCARSGYTFLGFIYNPAVADSAAKPAATAPTYKIGGVYTLQANLKVRTGAGTSYRQKTVGELTASGKAAATRSSATAPAVLKVGTKVTCKQISGSWIKIPSGWICCKEGNKIYIK